MNDLRFQMSVWFDRQYSDGYWQVEAAWAAGARIEIEDSFLRDEIRDVGVAVEDGGELRRRRIQVQCLQVVEHVEVEAGVRRALDEDDVGFRELGAGAFAVDVAADGGDGSDPGEFVEDGDFSYVAAVQDTVHAREGRAAKRGKDFRPKQAVGIGDDSEFHVFRISRAGGGRLREGTYAN